MTLDTCKLLLAHYEKSMADKDISIIARDLAKKNFEDMKANIAFREKNKPSLSPKPASK